MADQVELRRFRRRCFRHKVDQVRNLGANDARVHRCHVIRDQVIPFDYDHVVFGRERHVRIFLVAKPLGDYAVVEPAGNNLKNEGS